MTQKLLIALLDTIHLESGIGQPILENCRALDYIKWGWIPQIRDFLWHINGRIIGATKKPTTYREKDTYLMDATYIDQIPRRDKIYIHQCRIYLQVATMSDIASSDGSRIHKAWYEPDSIKPSCSTVRWPRQALPNRTAWKAWTRFLDSFCTVDGKLKMPVGKWTRRNNNRSHKSYFQAENKTLWMLQDTLWSQHQLIHQHRKTWHFCNTVQQQATEPPMDATPIDVTNIFDTHIITLKALPAETTEPEMQNAKHWYNNPINSLSHIVGDITILNDTEDITNVFTSPTHIEIASDGGHDPESGISTYGWVVSADKQLIAKGRGPAQAHPLLAESFRSEGYGLTSALIFVHNLVKTFHILPQEHRWTIYIDNKALIQRMDGYSQHVTISR
jgi:hypothetical protein